MIWEYTTYFIDDSLRDIEEDHNELVESLNVYGEDQWELIAVIYNAGFGRLEYYFKRQLPERK